MPHNDNLHEELRDLIRRMEPGDKLPTVRRLIIDFKTNYRCLSGVLGQLEKESLIRRRQGSGIYVSPQKEEVAAGLLVGVPIPALAMSQYWSRLILEISHLAETNHVPLHHFYTHVGGMGSNHTTRPFEEAFRREHIHSFILLGAASQLNWLQSLGKKTISLGAPGGNYSAYTDFFDGLRLHYQVAQRLGARKIAYVVRNEDRTSREIVIKNHKNNHWNLLAEKITNIPDAEVWVEDNTLNELTRKNGPSVGREMIREHLGSRAFRKNAEHAPDFIIIPDEHVALGALIELEVLGWKLGVDLHVSVSATQGCVFLQPFASRIVQVLSNPSDAAEKLTGRLFQLLQGQTPEVVREKLPLYTSIPDSLAPIKRG